MIEQRIQEARRLHVRGELARAISTYDEVLAGNPELADVWHLKGMAEHQSGRLEQAQASVARAIATGGEKPAFLFLEAGVLHDRGELAAAQERFSRVLQTKPDWAAAHVGLGLVHMDQGKALEAIEDFRAAVKFDPGNVRAWNNLGMTQLVANRIDEAIRAFDYALSLDANYATAHFNLARIYSLRAENQRALDHAQAAVKIDSGLMDAWLLVGDIHHRQGEMPPALAAYTMAVRAAPANLKARIALAELLGAMGRTDEARRELRRVAEHSPGSLKAALGANLTLPQVYSSLQHLETSRREYAEGLERLHQRAGDFRAARGEAALAEARWTNFYLAYQGRNDRALQRRYGELQRRMLEAGAPEFLQPRRARAARDRIRVGFFSHYFFNCTAGRYFASWITRLDRARFEAIVYYTNEWMADDSRTIAAAAAAFRHLPGRPLYTLAQNVAGDELDILVYPELGMHADTFTLAGLRLAPVQCSGWGHPTTPGLPEIDWFISCEAMEPANGAEHYNERLALLPGLGTRYPTLAAAAGGTRSDFGIPEDRTAYLVPQSLFKIHPDNDDLLAEVLAQDPRGVAIMFASRHDLVTESFGARLAGSLERRGLDIHERVVFLRPGIPHADYLRLNQLCDVMLDTLHWSGGNTSLDALASALPVVTLPGELMRGRQSQAMLRMLGLEELIASDAADYVAKAVGLGRDPEARKAIAERMRANRGALFEREEPIRSLEGFLARAVEESRA